MCVKPFYSKLNHACHGAANIYWCFNGREMQIRAEKDIAPFEELLTGYTIRDTYERRKARLMRTWGFECSCSLG